MPVLEELEELIPNLLEEEQEETSDQEEITINTGDITMYAVSESLHEDLERIKNTEYVNVAIGLMYSNEVLEVQSELFTKRNLKGSHFEFSEETYDSSMHSKLTEYLKKRRDEFREGSNGGYIAGKDVDVSGFGDWAE